jgi:RimJ/RimL family protein N-acetyltransferase
VYMCVDIDEQNIASQRAFEKIWFEKVWYWKNINNSPESWKQRFVYMRIS